MKEDIHNAFLHKTLLEIKQMEQVEIHDGSRWAKQELISHMLLYVVNGKGKLYMNDGCNAAELLPNTVFLLPVGTVLATECAAEHGLHLYKIEFDIYRAMEWSDKRRVYEKELTLPVSGEIRVEQHHRIRRLIRLLCKDSPSITRMAHFSPYQPYLHDLLSVIFDNRMSTILESTDNLLDYTIEYIQQAFSTNITLAKLADQAGMNPSYFSQLFKRKMKKSPIEYLTDLRMNQAKKQLQQPNGKIRDIAQDVGYKDEFYFSRRFKTYSGIAPTAYMKQQHIHIVSLSQPYTDHLLTLGVKPLAIHIDKEAPMMSMPVYDRMWERYRETLLMNKPDMILCKDHISQQMNRYFGDIAPIVTIPWKRLDVFGHMREIARLVGKENEAYEWIARHEERVERDQKKVKAMIGEGTVGLLTFVDHKVKLYGARNIGHVFYRSLNLSPPEQIRREIDKYLPGTVFNWMSATTANLSDCDTDYLFLVTKSGEWARDSIKELQQSEGWRSLPAVKYGNVHVLDWDKWMMYSPRSIESQLSEAVSLLMAAK
ncbi:AraC family transcriptional regulator [Paenibacillus alvei]|uniref:AraC family transcriptional regulator n=1 Tax=Paenibacillus alvei TaxID=44250 RepID=UPI000386082F|nr:AraC family transcriptional regulator [Paenibacillus alvei]EPY13111.1 AraC family transcriptional regulator [Paenibacillus alvei A6-6i-x]